MLMSLSSPLPSLPTSSSLLPHCHSQISRSVCACVSPSPPYLPFCVCLCLTVTPISPVPTVLVSNRHSHISRFFLCLCLTVTPKSPVLSVLVSHRYSHISRSDWACVSPSLPYPPFCLNFVYCNTSLRYCFSFLTYPFSSAPLSISFPVRPNLLNPLCLLRPHHISTL